MVVASMIVWIEERSVVWLGQEPPTKVELEKEVVEEKEKLSTSEKILIISLFLNVVTLAWSVYQWQEGKK